VAYFRFENERFESTFDVEGSERSTAQELVRELVEWRLTDYFARASARNSDHEYRLKVIRSGENPILLLPDRAAKPDLPEGWTDVHADGRVLSANFVKIAINVVREPAEERNVLPEILRGWFGADAGKPGTTHQVVLKQSRAGWSLAPAGIVAAGLPTLYKAYVRADIPPLFGLIYSSFYWQQGFIRQGDSTFLLVTLDKSAHEEAFRYQDHFVSPTEFQWQSQNRTTQSSKDGLSICDHVRMGIHVHLFVRSKGKTPDGRGAPFYYLGRVNFKSWHGEKPITVQWELQDSIPPLLWKELNVRGGVA
jgi:Domain of unknown function (DUF3427)